MSNLYFVFEKRRRYSFKQKIIPANTVAFILCIWKAGFSKLTPVNTVAFVPS